MATKTRLTLEEFLALPESEPPCEYLDGEVVQKVSPNIPHSILAVEIAGRLRDWVRANEPCLVGVEGRHVAGHLNRAYLPDVHLTKMSRIAGHENESPMTVTPDVVVEILSPDDRPTVVVDKVEMYVALGVPVLLLVDPGDRTIREYRAALPSRIYHEGDTLDLSPVLPGFRLDVSELFAILPGQD
ncbi:MAG: Uma2 family endonuclease [Dehalococcoidia bacterium]